MSLLLLAAALANPSYEVTAIAAQGDVNNPDPFVVDVTVRNVGTAMPAGSGAEAYVTVHVAAPPRQTPSGTPFTGSQRVCEVDIPFATLGAFQSTTLTVTCPNGISDYPGAGTWYVYGRTFHRLPGGNLATGPNVGVSDDPFRITAPPDVDYTLSIQSAPTEVAQGASFRVDYEVRNIGSTSGQGSFANGFYLLDGGTEVFLCEDSLVAVQANSSRTGSASCTMPADRPTGPTQLFGRADFRDNQPEIDLTNNDSALFDLTITAANGGQDGAGPDLAILGADAPPSALAPGAAMSLAYVLANLGDGDAGPSTTGVYLSAQADPAPDDTLLCTDEVGTFPAGDQDVRTVPTCPLPAEAALGTAWVHFIADDARQLADADRSNNIYTFSLDISADGANAFAADVDALADAFGALGCRCQHGPPPTALLGGLALLIGLRRRR